MLYLKQTREDAEGDAPHRVPLSSHSAACLETALLARENQLRRQALHDAIGHDSALAGWALRLAERRTSRTINRVEEAAEWLLERLEVELADALESDASGNPSDRAEARLLAIVAKVADCQRRLNDFDRRLEHQKLESLKELAYGASHEINNPLANIAARAQTLLAEEDDPERARKLTAIHRQAMRAHEMISDLMLFARPPKLLRQPIDLRQLVNRVVDELRPLAEERGVEIECASDGPPIESMADSTQLGVAVAALVKNALEATPPGGHVCVATEPAPDASPFAAQIRVTDDGPGISDAVRQHLFDPFFSGREAGRGLGFGLSKCWRIVTDHGGQLTVEKPGSLGAEFTILLPAPAAPP